MESPDTTQRKRGADRQSEPPGHAAEVAGENWFRLVADYTYDWEYWIGQGGELKYVSPSCQRITGWPPADFLADPDLLETIVHPDDQAAVREHFQAEAGSLSPLSIAYRIRTADGHERWIEHFCQPVYGSEGQCLGRRASNRDITSRKQAESAARLAEEQARLAVEAGRMATWDRVLPDGPTVWNDEHYRMLGYEPGAVQASYQAWAQRVHPDDLPGTTARFQRSLDAGGDFTSEFRVVLPDGTIRWLEARGRVGRDAAGRPTRSCGVMLDVTERKRTEEALRELNESLHHRITEWEAMLRVLPMGVAIADDPSGERIRVNPVLADLLGMGIDRNASLAVPEGRQAYRAVRDDRELSVGELPMQRAVRGETVRESEIVAVRSDGQRVHMLASAVPLRDPQGRLRGAVGSFLDITRRKQLEEETRQAKRAAETASLAKSLFLATMSHELRTPMTAIIGMLQQVLEEGLPGGIRDCLETAKGSADSLHAILNDILDFSRIEAGKLPLESAAFLLRPTVQDAIRLLQLPANQKGLALEWEIPADVPDAVVGDSLRLRQVLTNLIGNAVKFTEQGRVSVRVGREAPTAQQACLRFEVCDSGIGIAPERLEHIFDPFTQADASTTRQYGGTGLGLAISAALVQRMGGTIGVQSQSGQGSTFYFTLPFPQATDPSQPAACPARTDPVLTPVLRPLRILLVEDTPANQKLILRILGKRGHAVDVAGNGQEAMERVRHQDYDAVLMDVAMPVMDGFEATRAIRALGDSRKSRLPIIAMTAHAINGDRQRCLEHGMDEYLSKPVDARQLTQLVEQLAHSRAT